ncbi:Lar family restriction alleviation protein [Klebsiella quasivariicola]|uniref:Lar family restriction alleviation protein n=1 Tax=Klebsiella quasivariicola TaxID=2026240 RepID=UPI00247ABDFE|nr:Lar family restriction alleviation protein [Klebsiella quasivariicola]
MRHEAKSCPFCGCKVISVREISGHFRASCSGCEAKSAYQESEEAAVERWNKREGDGQ